MSAVRNAVTVLCLSAGIVASSAAQTPAPKSAREFVEQYEAGEFNAAVRGAAAVYSRDLRVLIKDLTAVVQAIAPDLKAHQKRRLTIAAFALEVVMENRSKLWRDSGQLLLEWACSLLRRNDTPLPAERLWHLAALGVIEGAPDATRLELHLAHSEKRFPLEPRVALARALVWEMKTWPEYSGPDFNAPQFDGVGPAFARAAAVPEIQAEAQLRWGFTELRAGKPARALEHFEMMAATPDVFLDFMKHLLIARAREAVGPAAQGIDAYRRAIAIAPGAQSARLGLAGLLARENRRVEAAAIVHETLTNPTAVNRDPWLSYGAADQRFWPIHATELRRQILR